MLSGKTRMVGAAVGVVAVVALAVVVFGSSGSSSSSDPYTLAANRLCLRSRHEVARAKARHRNAADRPNSQALARSLFGVVGGLRVRLGRLDPPADRVIQTVELGSALYDFERGILQLFQLQSSDRSQFRAAIKEIEAGRNRARAIAASLDLAQCARLAQDFALNSG